MTNEELDAFGRGALRKAAKEGDENDGSFLCGQIAGLVNEKMSAEDIIVSVCSEAEELMKGASKWIK